MKTFSELYPIAFNGAKEEYLVYKYFYKKGIKLKKFQADNSEIDFFCVNFPNVLVEVKSASCNWDFHDGKMVGLNKLTWFFNQDKYQRLIIAFVNKDKFGVYRIDKGDKINPLWRGWGKYSESIFFPPNLFTILQKFV